jgi:hypothetical protein
VQKALAWPKAAVKQTLNLALPRGVRVRGQVTELASGKPVAGANVDFWPRVSNNPYYREDVPTGMARGVATEPDGAFQITVPPGPGHLAVQSGVPDFIQRVVYYDYSTHDVSDKPSKPQDPNPSETWYVAGLTALDVKRSAEPPEVKIVLRRGVSVKGRLLEPDGQPVARAKMLCRLAVASAGYGELWPVELIDGQFELPGCDPGKTYPVYFLDAQNQCGAVTEISGQQAGGAPVTVRLAPCGSAVLRFVDHEGKPRSNYRPNALGLQLVMRPVSLTAAKTKGQQVPAAETVRLVNLDPLHYRQDVAADGQGCFTLPALIPGARYQVLERGQVRGFTSVEGKNLKLPDLVIP